MPEIVKVQRPQSTSNATALVYSRGRCDLRLQQLDRATRKALAGDPKGYFEGELGAEEWAIGKRVAEQPW